MRSCTYRILILLHTTLIVCKTQAQHLPDSTLQKIDQLFAKWNNPNSPGCVVGIVRNDTILFSKGYGIANLEYGVPNTPASIFHVASVSKQFTGYAIALLARQGLLGLDDDVRKHLPWFPDLKEKITIRQLLNHTSGIRDQWQLLAMAGTRLDDVITQDQIIKMLSRQQALNSKPGERYNYCNSGYTMLAEIVRTVSGQTLRHYTETRIFKPLGMRNTHFHDDYTEIVKDRAYSYRRTGMNNKFANAVLSYSNTGATSLFTNVNDLSRWVMNFYDPKAGSAEDISLLIERGKLNNGKQLDYAMGIGNLTYKGWQRLAHDGADAGYRTAISVFPELKMGFIVLANVGDLSPGQRVSELIDLFVPDRSPGQKEDQAKEDTSLVILKNPQAIKKFEGNYISEEGSQARFRLRNDKLYADGFGRSSLLKEENGTFSMLGRPAVQFVFNIPAPGDTTVLVTFSPGETALFKKYSPVPHTNGFLQAYAGTYYSPELDCSYGIEVKNDRLVLTNTKYNNTWLQLQGPDHLTCDYWWMGHLHVIRNDKGAVTGFEVNSGRVLHLRFNKM